MTRPLTVFKYSDMVVIVDGGVKRIVCDSAVIQMSEDDIKKWHLRGGE